MQKEDFRKLSSEVRADRRKIAFTMLDEGFEHKLVAKRVGVHITTISDWKKKRKQLEENNYHGLKRGNPENQRYLDDTQEKEVLDLIKNSLPNKEGVSAYLWSRKAIQELVKKKYNIDIAFQTISDYTKKWGLSSQRPAKQACEQDEKKIKEWLEITYPKIKEEARRQDAEIHWADETNLNINTNYQKTYAPKGKTPIAKIPARKTSYSLISSLTNQGKLRYMAYKGGMNTDLFLVFLKRLVKDTDKKVFLIVDNLKVHHSKKATKWVKENSTRIEVFFPTAILSTR